MIIQNFLPDTLASSLFVVSEYLKTSEERVKEGKNERRSGNKQEC